MSPPRQAYKELLNRKYIVAIQLGICCLESLCKQLLRGDVAMKAKRQSCKVYYSLLAIAYLEVRRGTPTPCAARLCPTEVHPTDSSPHLDLLFWIESRIAATFQDSADAHTRCAAGSHLDHLPAQRCSNNIASCGRYWLHSPGNGARLCARCKGCQLPDERSLCDSCADESDRFKCRHVPAAPNKIACWTLLHSLPAYGRPSV